MNEIPLKQFSYFLMLSLTLSCSGKNSQSILIKSNLNPGQFNEFIIGDRRTYIIGEEKEKSDFSAYQTVFYKSSRNDYKSWEKINTSVPGMNQLAVSNNENIFIVNKVLKSGDSYSSAKIILFKFDTRNEKYEYLYNFGKEFIKSIHFINENIGYIFSRVEGTNFIKETKDGGKSWNKILELKGSVGRTYKGNGKIYFSSRTKDAKSISLYSFDLQSQKIELLVEKGFKFEDFHVDNCKNYWLLGKSEGSEAILKRCNKGGKCSNVSYFPFNTKKIHKYGSFIAVLTYGVDESLLGGLGGTRYLLHVSYDNGNHWQEISFPDENYVKPFIFYQDEFFLAYSGDGKLTFIDFKKGVW